MRRMPPRKKTIVATTLVQEWSLPAAATLGSSVRTRGLLLEIRAKLPAWAKKWLDVEGGSLALRVPDDSDADLRTVLGIIARTLDGIENLPVIPREIQDILAISATERHRWLKDGRLQSAGTRTVKLHGRARKITFHVFDPRHVEDLLDRDVVDQWREDDVIAAAENRRRAAEERRLVRLQKSAPAARPDIEDADHAELRGFAEFMRNGPLR